MRGQKLVLRKAGETVKASQSYQLPVAAFPGCQAFGQWFGTVPAPRRRGRREGVRLLADYLESRVAAGELRPHDCEASARLVFYAVFAAHLSGTPPEPFMPAIFQDVLPTKSGLSCDLSANSFKFLTAARAAVPKQSERASERVSERKKLVRLSAPALPRSLAPSLPCSLAPSVVVYRLI